MSVAAVKREAGRTAPWFRRARPPGAVAAALLMLGACAGPAQIARVQAGQDSLQRFVAATQEALACRAAAAANPRYADIRRHMPLGDAGEATLPQLLDPSRATKEEVVALAAWVADSNACRQRLLQVADGTFPSFGPIIEAARDQDDVVFVRLADRELTWGQAVIHLRRNGTKLRHDLIARADRVAADIDKMQQEQLNRRTTILSSVIRILP